MHSTKPQSHRHRLLLGGICVPIALIGSLLGASPASAAVVASKAALVTAVQNAPGGSTVTVDVDLRGDGGSSDVVTLPNARSLTLDLNGHDVDLDRVVIPTSSFLTVADMSGTGAELTVGGASVSPSDSGPAGVQLAASGRLEVGSFVHLTATGSARRAAIGTVAGSDTNALLYIDDGAAVDATGGARGAGIGGGEGATPLSTVSIGNAVVHASGGAGAAGIGGGAGSTGAGSAVSIENGDVTVADGRLAADASGSQPPSAVGGGQGSPASAFGTLTNTATAGRTSILRIAAGSTLTVPSGQAMRSSGDLVVDGTLTGGGTIDNTDGTIRQGAGGTIDDAQLTITGRNHAVAFSPGAGSVTAPATKHVYATTFANAGLDLGAYTGSAGARTLVGWSGVQSGVPLAHVTNDDGLAALSSSGGESDPVTLTAAYETAIAFTGAALPNAATGQRYEQAAPVTGDATAFAVAGDPAPGLPPGTIPAFPVGLGLDPGSGLISGRPAEGGRYSFVLTASSAHQRVSRAVTIDIAGAPTIATTALPDGTSGTAYSAPVLASSDSGPVTYSITAGVLPGGLRLDPTTGVLAGTPDSSGTFTFTVAAANAYGSTDRTLSLTISAASSAPGTADGAPDGNAPGGGAPGGNALAPQPAPAPPAAGSPVTNAPAAAPVLPLLPTTIAKLGHPLALSLAASSTVPVMYSVRPKELPAGISLDRSTGLLFGAPRAAGRSLLHVTAPSSAGSTSRAYTVVVPEATRLVTGSASAITPRVGARLTITIRGLLAGERWRVALNGRQVRTGIAKFGGSVKQTVRIPAGTKDTKHRIRVSGDRRLTDPATVAHHELVVTAVTGHKTLRLSRSGRILTVRGLAAKERVTIRRGTTVLARGRADALGVFVVRTTRLKHGVHTVTGSTKHRSGRLVVR